MSIIDDSYTSGGCYYYLYVHSFKNEIVCDCIYYLKAVEQKSICTIGPARRRTCERGGSCPCDEGVGRGGSNNQSGRFHHQVSIAIVVTHIYTDKMVGCLAWVVVVCSLLHKIKYHMRKNGYNAAISMSLIV